MHTLKNENNPINKAKITAQIIERADKLGIVSFDKLSLFMDVECADKIFNLRLQDLLNFDDFNFKHDICGIQKNLDRELHTMKNLFVPRSVISVKALKEKTKYTLYNTDGCQMASIIQENINSLSKARKYFTNNYSGKYIIGWYDNKIGEYIKKNVILK